MRSMTGFGRAELERDGMRVVAEARSLNQRFFELKLNLPRGWGPYEVAVRRQVSAVVSRGRVEVFIRQVLLKPPRIRLDVNEGLARRYVVELRRLGRKLRLKGDVGMDAIVRRPEILHLVEEEEGRSPAGARLGLQALSQALESLKVERRREGEKLKRDFTMRIARVRGLLPRIERLAERNRARVIKEFHARVRSLLKEVPVNERRLNDEAASAAARGDISEEMTRLRIHLDALGRLVARKGPVGRAIEFLLQEVNREVNTMGAKSQSASLSQLTVEIKTETERMREQVQNVE